MNNKGENGKFAMTIDVTSNIGKDNYKIHNFSVTTPVLIKLNQSLI